MSQTHTGVVVGTAAYMSPEQARGLPVDKRTDIWAFGCVLYEVLTGRRVVEASGVADALAQVLSRDPDWSQLPPTTPTPIVALLRQCLERDPRERIGDMAAASFVLKDVRSLSRPGSDSSSYAAAAEAQSRRGWTRVAVFSAVALLAGASLTFVTMRLVARPLPPLVARTTITPPAAARLSSDGADRSVAITSDGTRVIYLGTDKTQIFVRALDNLQPVPIVTGASLLRGIFLSPDDQWVGYYESNTILKKVAITGGSPVTVLSGDAPSRGAVWTADNTIVFGTGSSDTGLLRISANGGPVTVLTRPRPELGEFDHVTPSLLPDGRGLLFTITTSGGQPPRVAVLDPAAGSWKTIVEGGGHPAYLPSGHLVYTLGTTLRAVAFDLARLETRGPAATVVPRMIARQLSAEFSVAGNGTLVYLDSGGPLEPTRSLAWVSRDGQATPWTYLASGGSHIPASPRTARASPSTPPETSSCGTSFGSGRDASRLRRRRTGFPCGCPIPNVLCSVPGEEAGSATSTSKRSMKRARPSGCWRALRCTSPPT